MSLWEEELTPKHTEERPGVDKVGRQVSASRDRALPGTESTSTLILDLQNCEKINVCCWSHPISCILLWLPEVGGSSYLAPVRTQDATPLTSGHLFPDASKEQWGTKGIQTPNLPLLLLTSQRHLRPEVANIRHTFQPQMRKLKYKPQGHTCNCIYWLHSNSLPARER